MPVYSMHLVGDPPQCAWCGEYVDGWDATLHKCDTEDIMGTTDRKDEAEPKPAAENPHGLWPYPKEPAFYQGNIRVIAEEAPMDIIDQKVMERLRAPFACEFVGGRWRIHDANDDAIASCAPAEEGYARLIVGALNDHFARREEAKRLRDCTGRPGPVHDEFTYCPVHDK